MSTLPKKRKSFGVIISLIWIKNWEKQMLRSRLKNQTNKTKIDVDIAAYKKQRNYVVALNQKSKWNYFNNLDVSKGVKPFWKTCKPYFSKKHSRGDTIIIIIKKMNYFSIIGELRPLSKIILQKWYPL